MNNNKSKIIHIEDNNDRISLYEIVNIIGLEINTDNGTQFMYDVINNVWGYQYGPGSDFYQVSVKDVIFHEDFLNALVNHIFNTRPLLFDDRWIGSSDNLYSYLIKELLCNGHDTIKTLKSILKIN